MRSGKMPLEYEIAMPALGEHLLLFPMSCASARRAEGEPECQRGKRHRTERVGCARPWSRRRVRLSGPVKATKQALTRCVRALYIHGCLVLSSRRARCSMLVRQPHRSKELSFVRCVASRVVPYYQTHLNLLWTPLMLDFNLQPRLQHAFGLIETAIYTTTTPRAAGVAIAQPNRRAAADGVC